MREREKCPGCGTRGADWDPQEGGSLDAYTPIASICHGCRAVAQKAKDYEKAPAAGVQIMLRRSRVQ